jgi:nucleoid DNA-binding protein/cell division septation protein DedD
MEEYISLLLENNNRVIVPEFGAFIVKKRHPLSLVFNEFLQYNDGVLIDLISKKENIDSDQAKIKIEQFIKKINDSLDKGEAFQILKLGFLIKNKSGKISLEESETSIIGITKSEEKEISLDQDKSMIIEEPVAEKEIKKITNQPIVPPVQKIKEEAPPEISKPVEKKIKEPQSKENKKNKSDDSIKKKNIQEPIETTPVIDYQTVPKSRKNIIIWILVIIGINAAIIIYFFRYNKLSDLFLKTSINPEELISTDSIKPLSEKALPVDSSTFTKENSIVENQQISKPDKPDIKTIAPTGKRYYIVAGVFREEKNAQNFVKELRNKGFNSEQFAKIGASYGVSYSVFESKDDAEKNLSKIKKEIDPGAWIKVIE